MNDPKKNKSDPSAGDSADAVIEFQMDDTYFREYHSQWVAARGKGWRVQLVIIALSAVGGVALAIVDSLDGSIDFPFLIAVSIAVAAFETWQRFRRRKEWLEHCENLPHYGEDVRFEVRDGKVMQVAPELEEPVRERAAEFQRTPRGYLASFELEDPAEDAPASISQTTSSIYLPHRKIRPQMSREEFESLIEEMGKSAR